MGNAQQRHYRCTNTVLGVTTGAMLLVLSVSTPALAQWWQETHISGTVTAKQLSGPKIQSVVSLDALVQNHNYQTTEVITVQNPNPAETIGETPNEIRLVTSALPNTGLQQHMSVSVWPVPDGGACTANTDPPENAVTGHWTEEVVSAPAMFTAGAERQFCVRGYPRTSTPKTDRFLPEQNRPATVSAIATAGTTGSQAFTQAAQYRAQLTLGTDGIDSEPVNSSRVVATERIYPIETMDQGFRYGHLANRDNRACLMLYGTAGVADPPEEARLSIWDCQQMNAGNRWQRFQRITHADTGVVSIRVDGTSPNRGFLFAKNMDQWVGATSQDDSDPRQMWIPQVVAGIGTQLVNQYSGQCLTVPLYAYQTVNTNDCSVAPQYAHRFTTDWW